MCEACSNGHVEIAKLLLDAGADVNKTDKVCSKVLTLESSCLLSHFQDERGPLWAACSNGHVEMVKLLIVAGADANKTDCVCRSVTLSLSN